MTSAGLKITITQREGTVTLSMEGEAGLDFDASERHIRAVLAHAPQAVVVDAARLTFITSIGMCFLINLRRQMREAGGTMRLTGLGPQVRKVLEQAHVIHLFDVTA